MITISDICSNSITLAEIHLLIMGETRNTLLLNIFNFKEEQANCLKHLMLTNGMLARLVLVTCFFPKMKNRLLSVSLARFVDF